MQRYRGASADIHCPPVYTQQPPADADAEISRWLTQVLVLGLGDMHADAPPVVQDFLTKHLADILSGLKVCISLMRTRPHTVYPRLCVRSQESVCRELWGNEKYEEHERQRELELFQSAPTTPAQPPPVSAAGPQTPSAHLARELQSMELYAAPCSQQQPAAAAGVPAGGMGLAPMVQQRVASGELQLPPGTVPVYVQGYQPYVDGVEPLPQRQPQPDGGATAAANAAAAAAALVNGTQQMDCASPGQVQTV